MRTGSNIVLQLAALLLFAGLRATYPGWMLLIFILTAIGPILMLVPLGMAIGTRRRRYLTLAVAIPFVVTAVLLVLAGALIPDFGDTPVGYVPVAGEFPSSDPALTVLGTLGTLAAFGFVGGLVWTLVAVVVTSGRKAAAPDR